jgi:lipopolysaccharide transport system permease protein
LTQERKKPSGKFADVLRSDNSMNRSLGETLKLSFFLGWQDIRLMYRRSVLGQFWITLSMAITFAAIGSVFGVIFGLPLPEYLPHLGAGLVLWAFMSAILTEGSTSFIVSEAFIKQIPLPLTTYFMRTTWKTFFVFLHNMVALVILLLFFSPGISLATLGIIPGLLLLMMAVGGISLGIAVISTRFRDVPQILSSVVQVCFYLTPIVWKPESLPEGPRELILTWNPFYHLLQVTRQPLLNIAPTWTEWGTAALMAAVSMLIGTAIYRANRKRVAFWV